MIKDPNADRTSRTKATTVAGGVVVAVASVAKLFDVDLPVSTELLERLIEGALLAALWFLRDSVKG